jgi:hypothetical protein
MGFFDFFKKAASSVWNGIKSGGSRVLNWANKARDGINKGWNFVKKIPVVGNIADRAASLKLPLINMSLKDVAGTADTALDTANDIGRLAGIGPQQNNKMPSDSILKKRMQTGRPLYAMPSKFQTQRSPGVAQF